MSTLEKIKSLKNTECIVDVLLKEVLATGANDVYVVSRENAPEALLPAIKECIKNIDMESRVMEIHVMDGLL